MAQRKSILSFIFVLCLFVPALFLTACDSKTTEISYTITYELNGGTNSNNNPSSYKKCDANITLVPASKLGYTFLGWFAESNFSEESKITIIETKNAKDLMLFAKWSPNTYTANFVADGVIVGTADFTVENNSITEPPVPTKTGYVGAWEDYTLSANSVTINALYTPVHYTITLIDNEATTQNSYTVEDAVIAPTTSRTGYTFDFWVVTSANGNWEENTQVFEGTTINNMYGDVTFTANYTINEYTLTFVVDDNILTSITQNYGTAITLPLDPEKTGYSFAGWHITVPNTMPAENLTFNATWTPDEYTIIYRDKGGAIFSGSHSSGYMSIHTYGTETTLDNPTKQGYIFGGYYLTSDCLGEVVTNLGATDFNSTITLFALWMEE